MIWLADMKCSFLQLFTLNKTRRRASALPEEDDNFINITADVKPALLRNSVRDVLPILCINTLIYRTKSSDEYLREVELICHQLLF